MDLSFIHIICFLIITVSNKKIKCSTIQKVVQKALPAISVCGRIYHANWGHYNYIGKKIHDFLLNFGSIKMMFMVKNNVPHQIYMDYTHYFHSGYSHLLWYISFIFLIIFVSFSPSLADESSHLSQHHKLFRSFSIQSAWILKPL